MHWTDTRIPASSGFLADGFSSVGSGFAQNFEEGLELGASFAVMIDDELVIDIRGGFSDKAKETPWDETTLACIYSSGKAVLSLLIAREVSSGRLDYDRPVAEYWPEFAAAGKDDITIAQMLSHQAGLPGFPDEMPPETWLDWEAITQKLAAMAPLWAPGRANGYHPQTVGFIAGEVLRRVTGKTVGQLVAEFDLQIFCGMGADQAARAAYMPKPPKAPDLGVLNEFTKLAFLKKWSAPARVAREDWMAAELPASNMHADARSLAAIVHPFVNGGKWDGDPYLDEAAIAAALKERIRGDDLVLPFHLSWSAGLMRNINGHFGPNENAFGHAGFGGSCVIADPEHNLTAAYVMNKMSPYLVGDPRAVRLLDAVYQSL
ncbi:serine hydrolase domain-containing protein [Hyphococcus sp.]|uniref:serine hydrolase domain-containing protein n=1 Tax=Hyphococcus sp. TaxID=2038636 RepID=UPI003CCC00CB